MKKIFFPLFLLFLFRAGIAEAANLRLSPAAGSFVVGSTFDISVIMNTDAVPVNTIEVELNFPPDKLQIVNPSLGRSIVQIWASPPTFSNQEGRIYFIGGIPSPGINISEGVVQSFTFRVTAPGDAKISFGKNISILANDGFGTNVLKQTSPAVFSLVLSPAQGPEVFSPTHPEQGKWYQDVNPIMKWIASRGSEGSSYLMDHNPNTVPNPAIINTNSEATFTNLESGIWYFHVREKAGGRWGGVSHYSLNIDSLPPAEFSVAVSPSARTSNKNPIFRFFTTDSLSGFNYFEIKAIPLNKGPNESTFFFEASSPYQFSDLKTGRYEVIVRAYDKAGNFRDESVVLNILFSPLSFISSEGVDFVFFFVPWPVFLSIIASVILLMLIFISVVWIRHRHHLQHAFIEDLKKIWPHHQI